MSWNEQIKCYQRGTVLVYRYWVQWSGDLVRVTDTRQLAYRQHPGVVYLNPAFGLFSRALDHEFLQEIERAKILWAIQVSKQFGSGWAKHARRTMEPHVRRIMFSGVLRVDGVDRRIGKPKRKLETVSC